jgi:hypothetical protein
MKKVAILSGAFSGSCLAWGVLFKIMNWPGAIILQVLGLFIFSILFLPSLTKYLLDQNNY